MKNSARDTLALQHVLLLLATRMEGETLACRGVVRRTKPGEPRPRRS